jgi:cephalosporin hydroxylase
MKSMSYADDIPSADEFRQNRDLWRLQMGNSNELRRMAIDLTVASSAFYYGYQWEWCGVPIIRHPDDIVLQQEIMWRLKPSRVIETGVARGGSLVLSSSLMEISRTPSKVLGLDIQILPHAIDSLKPWLIDGRIELLECDSTSNLALAGVAQFLGDDQSPALLVLDSNHSHEHVRNELDKLAPLLPNGSIIIVADTIIQEMPQNSFPGRPWGLENNPLTAVNEFLELNSDFKVDQRWSRRSLMGECRDGILTRISGN